MLITTRLYFALIHANIYSMDTEDKKTNTQSKQNLKQNLKPAESFLIAISMYSIIPVPAKEWRKENMAAAICFLPVVGILVGAVLFLWQLLCVGLGIETVIFASVAAIIPVILTGGIHMDGFMDTADALGSHKSREEKLAIMKDSHAGAFAILWCAAYLLLSFGVYWALYEKTYFWLVGIIFVLSRCLCAISALTLPAARDGGILVAFTEFAKNRAAIVIMLVISVLCVAGVAYFDLYVGIVYAVIAIVIFFVYRGLALKQFGGVTGDTSGFFIQICELCLLYGVLIGCSL